MFENHIPQLSYLHGASVRTGANIVKRGAKAVKVYCVAAVEDSTARLQLRTTRRAQARRSNG